MKQTPTFRVAASEMPPSGRLMSPAAPAATEVLPCTILSAACSAAPADISRTGPSKMSSNSKS